MADSESTTKVEESNQATSEEGAEVLLSLDALDEIISSSDPEFLDSLKQIGPGTVGSIYAEGEDLQYSLDDELRIWASEGFIKRFVVRTLPIVPKISYQLKIKRTAWRLFVLQLSTSIKLQIKNAPPAAIKWFKGRLSTFNSSIKLSLSKFAAFPVKRKLAVVGLVVMTVCAAGFIYQMFTKGIFPPSQELFMSSMSEWAQKKYTFEPSTPLESFYESTRMTQNILLLKKMIVNLAPSTGSGSNPMGAFEFYVEGTVSEVVVEVKDREAEMTDLIQRTIAEMTFDQISSGEGKQLLCEKLRKEMNAVLTQGFIRRVFIKTAILKP